MNIKPLSDHVVIEPMAQEEKTKSGILLPQNADKEMPEQGKVVAVGPGKFVTGKRQALEIKQGDIVLFRKYSPTDVKVDNKKYLIAKQDDILAIIE